VSIKSSIRPVLVLIGVGGAVTTVLWLASPDHSPSPEYTVDVARTQYASITDCMLDWDRYDDCTYVDDPADPAVSASAAASGASSTVASNDGSPVGSAHAHGGGGWYGPYFTKGGTIYHQNGPSTSGNVPVSPHGTTTNLTMRENSLGHESSFLSSPRIVAAAEGHAISRGGFVSAMGESGHISHFGGGRSGGG